MCDKKLFEQKIMDLKEYRTAVRVRMRTEENLEQYIESKKSPKAAGGGGSGAGGSDLSRYLDYGRVRKSEQDTFARADILQKTAQGVCHAGACAHGTAQLQTVHRGSLHRGVRRGGNV